MTHTLTPGFYALIGPNFAGKTHYLHSLIDPDTAFLPAGADLHFAGRTVADHLRAANAVRKLDAVVLPDHVLETSTPRSLSVGKRRLLALSIALAAKKSTLLLDEPFDGLDTTSRESARTRLIEYIAEDSNRVIIMASHRPEDFAGLATHVIQVFEREIHEPVLIDDLRSLFPTVTGPTEKVNALVTGCDELTRSTLGPTTRVTLTKAPAGMHTAADITLDYPDDAQLLDILATTPAPATTATRKAQP